MAENTAIPGSWALLRGEQVEGWYTRLQLEKMTQTGQLLPLDLLKDPATGVIVPAWKLGGMFPGHKEPGTPIPGSLTGPTQLPGYLSKKARGLTRWRSRRMRVAIACLGGMGISLAGPWDGTVAGIFHLPALGLACLGFLAAVFLAWPGSFFQVASIVCAGLALAVAFGFGAGLAGWGFWLGMAVCGVILLAGVRRMVRA